jgi:DNA-binding NarL/FixJ family response regulator
VVVLDDDRLFRRSVVRALHLEGFLVLEAEDVTALAATLEDNRVDVILADSRLADGSDGWREAEALAARHGGVRVVAVSGYDIDAIEATGGSVTVGYVLKDGSAFAMLKAVEAALGA